MAHLLRQLAALLLLLRDFLPPGLLQQRQWCQLMRQVAAQSQQLGRKLQH
jgi:hypothetical protein